MKVIYCIEQWLKEYWEDCGIWERSRDGSLWGCLEQPWKIGCYDIINEYESESLFKKDLYNIINHGGIISKVYMKLVDNNYKSSNLYSNG